MSPQTYHFLHIVGVLCLFISIGGLFGVVGGVATSRKMVAILHGIGLLLLLVAGIGYLHKSGLGFPNWAIAKIVIWVIMGALPVIIKKRLINVGAGVTLGLVLGSVAAYLAYFKPF